MENKIYIISFFFLAFCLKLNCQNAYSDAKKIMANRVENEIVYVNLHSSDTRARYSERELAYIENLNRFLQNPFSDSIDIRFLQATEMNHNIRFRASETPPQYRYAQSTLKATDAHSNISVFNTPINKSMMPAQFADATAQFLIKRSRDEMMGVFFERFKAKLEEQPMLKSLMPATQKLMNFQNSANATPSLGQSWMNVFESDMRNVLFNFDFFLREKHPQLLQQTDGQLFSLSLQTVRLLGEQQTGAQILQFFEEKEGKDLTEIGRSLRLVSYLSKNLLIDPKSDDWISRDSLQALGTEGGQIFWGLLYQRNRALFKKLNMQPTSQNVQQLMTMTDEFLHYNEKMNALSPKDTPSVKRRLKTFQNETSTENAQESDRITVVLDKAQCLLQIMELGFKAKYYLENTPDKYYSSDIFTKRMSLPRNTLNVFRLMHHRQYGIALLGTAELMEQLLPTTDATTEKSKKALRQFVFYANFMTDVITADNASLGSIVERYAMPTGSYRAKRAARFSMDINAYPGFFVAFEATKTDSTRSGSGVHGVSAPIGISFSFGKEMQEKASHSFSIYVPMLDIGAAFSYRWSQGKGGGLPEKFKLSQIFAPGIYAVWGVKGAPLSVMGGFQLTPQLRQVVDFKNITSGTANSIRFGLTVCMDVPIVGLYRR